MKNYLIFTTGICLTSIACAMVHNNQPLTPEMQQQLAAQPQQAVPMYKPLTTQQQQQLELQSQMQGQPSQLEPLPQRQSPPQQQALQPAAHYNPLTTDQQGLLQAQKEHALQFYNPLGIKRNYRFNEEQKQPNQPTEQLITDEIVRAYSYAKFKKALKEVEMVFAEFQRAMQSFYNALETFAQQPLTYQQDYANLQQLFIPFDTVKQKPLTIALARLIQHKKSATKQDITQANELINNLTLTISDVENLLAELGQKSEWRSTTLVLDKPNSTITLAEMFNEALVTKFPFKVQKIKRSLLHWSE